MLTLRPTHSMRPKDGMPWTGLSMAYLRWISCTVTIVMKIKVRIWLGFCEVLSADLPYLQELVVLVEDHVDLLGV